MVQEGPSAVRPGANRSIFQGTNDSTWSSTSPSCAPMASYVTQMARILGVGMTLVSCLLLQKHGKGTTQRSIRMYVYTNSSMYFPDLQVYCGTAAFTSSSKNSSQGISTCCMVTQLTPFAHFFASRMVEPLEQEQLFNSQMSTVRQSVEWGVWQGRV